MTKAALVMVFVACGETKAPPPALDSAWRCFVVDPHYPRPTTHIKHRFVDGRLEIESAGVEPTNVKSSGRRVFRWTGHDFGAPTESWPPARARVDTVDASRFTIELRPRKVGRIEIVHEISATGMKVTQTTYEANDHATDVSIDYFVNAPCSAVDAEISSHPMGSY